MGTVLRNPCDSILFIWRELRVFSMHQIHHPDAAAFRSAVRGSADYGLRSIHVECACVAEAVLPASAAALCYPARSLLFLKRSALLGLLLSVLLSICFPI